jgi:4-oxalocrotonate tautomerase
MPLVQVKDTTARSRPGLAAEIAATATRLSAEILHKDPKVTAVIAEEVPGERRFCGGVSLADKGLASFWLDIRITESTNTKDEKAAFIAETFRAMEALLGPLHEESYACA